jgi:hypothetical protein
VPAITGKAKLAKRTITTEVAPGLTCIGESVFSDNIAGNINGKTAGGSNDGPTSDGCMFCSLSC